MQAHRTPRLVASCLAALALAACGGGSSPSDGAAGSGAAAGSAGAPGEPPGPADGKPACFVSADCPAGSHCDLGQCVQACSAEQACAAGTTCSPRARCLPTGEPDVDPPPPAALVGQISTPAYVIPLSERSTTLDLLLEATSTSPVRYRLEVEGPHLSAPVPRGEFVGKTTISLPVDLSKVIGQEAAGSVHIFTTLGNLVVNAPLHAGVTGVYRGTLRFDGGSAPLGDARVAIDLREADGLVEGRVRGGESLLYPPTEGGEATGRGTTAPDGSVEIAFDHHVGADVGGARNVFRRPLGRRLALRLQPDGRGRLAGTFDETVFGLFAQPFKRTGTVTLDYQAGVEAPVFNVLASLEMPQPAPFAPAVGDVFAWKEPANCAPYVAFSSSSLATNLTSFSQPLTQAMASLITTPSSDPFVPIAQACEAALEVEGQAQYEDTTAKNCVQTPGLACIVTAAAAGSAADVARGKVLGRAVAALAAPHLLVAKDKAVRALYASFGPGGPTSETEPYVQGTEHLRRASTWLLQPAVLDALRTMSPVAARGDVPADGTTATQAQVYPAARALADLFATLAALDGELTRVKGAQGGDTAALARELQERALFAYLQSVTLAALVEAWTGVPEAVSASLAGVLTPLDRGFGAVLEGAAAFGVPQGFVPFVYDPQETVKGSTNFAQMFAIAQGALAAEASAEEAFVANKRAYEANVQSLALELNTVRTQYDDRIKLLCGAAFDPDAVAGDEDWERCGIAQDGTIGEVRVDIGLANQRLVAAQARLGGLQRKIAVDQDVLARTQNVRRETLRFLDRNGQALEANTLTQASLSAMQRMIESAGQAQLFNAFAPVGFGVFNAQLELMKGEAQAARDRLQTAQTMRFEDATKQAELIRGMGDIQKQTIDVTQLGVEETLEVMGVVQASLRLHNALAEAKALYEERGRALALAGMSPATDPAFRLVRDRAALDVLAARSRAQRQLYLAGRALEYETNTPLPSLEGATLRARSHQKLGALASCLQGIADDYRLAYGASQEYSTDVSVRRMLGVLGPRLDEVTGEELSEGAQFRRILLQNQNFDGRGGVGLRFATNLQPDNDLWSTGVCGDRIASVSAQLVGDFLGDNAAELRLSVAGGAALRACDGGELRTWFAGAGDAVGAERAAVVQAGVNGFGDAPANTALFGQSVARAAWELVLPGAAEAPSNRDVDATKLEDVVLRIKHRAYTLGGGALGVDLSCLGGT